MDRDQADATRSVLAQDSVCDLRERNLDPLLDHLARMSVLLALENELKAFVRARNADSTRGGSRTPFAVGRSAINFSKRCLGSLKRDFCSLYQHLSGPRLMRVLKWQRSSRSDRRNRMSRRQYWMTTS
jgi:hypothetical protein